MKKNLQKKLSLNKNTVANLGVENMRNVIAGNDGKTRVGDSVCVCAVTQDCYTQDLSCPVSCVTLDTCLESRCVCQDTTIITIDR